jgi:hypothetical protein
MIGRAAGRDKRWIDHGEHALFESNELVGLTPQMAAERGHLHGRLLERAVGE